jgi:hypothetical protein
MESLFMRSSNAGAARATLRRSATQVGIESLRENLPFRKALIQRRGGSYGIFIS